MNITVISYVIYLAISIRLTVWVARTLHQNGRIFLVHAFRGDETLADSINHLLVVGFYLINIGYVSLMLKATEKPGTLEAGIEFISWKIGTVLLVLGTMHFMNIYIFNRFRISAQHTDDRPPVHPDAYVMPRG